MASQISHAERIKSVLAGEQPDRPAVALWRHFPVDDQTAGGLAAATLHFQRNYDFDLVKVTPSSSFCLQDWGVIDVWRGNPEGTREYTRRAVDSPGDWSNLKVLDPRKGQLAEQIECLRLLAAELSPDTPFIQTIFSPLSQAKNLVGGDNLLVMLRTYPDFVPHALETITESTIKFIQAAAETGIDGIFYAIQHAQYRLLSAGEFAEFGARYDRRILAEAAGLWLNLLHLHGDGVMFETVSGFPAQVINWHDRQTTPSLKEGQSLFPAAVCGGLRQWETMVMGTPEQVAGEAQDAIRQTMGRRFILGTGCVTPITAPHGNILAARRAVEAA
jgi:uroporphyrinogen decarboxylase